MISRYGCVAGEQFSRTGYIPDPVLDAYCARIETKDIRAWADAWEADGEQRPDATYLRAIADEIDRLRAQWAMGVP